MQCCKSYFKTFLPQEAPAFGNNIKKNHKSHAQNEKICIFYICREYLLYLLSNSSGSFLQKYINFVEQ